MYEIIILIIFIFLIICFIFFLCFINNCSILCFHCSSNLSNINNSIDTNNSFDINTTNNLRKSDTNKINNILQNKQCNLTSTSNSFVSIEI
jgi:hypothetical protein